MNSETKQQLKLAIQGQKNSYHEQALFKLNAQADFENFELIPIYCTSFEGAFDMVKNDQADYALLAIENGVHGHIYQTLDIVMKNKAAVLAEVYLPVHHQLASPGTDLSLITDIYSHFAAFSQCDQFLEEYLAGAAHHVVEDTAMAAELVKLKADSSAAAICSAAAAEHAELNVISENIENYNDNVTRFFLLGKKDAPDLKLNPKNIDKTSLILTTSHSPGALFKALEAFYLNHLNLSSLTSRPGDGGSINYRFYIEVESAKNSANFLNAIRQIESAGLGQVDVLGSY